MKILIGLIGVLCFLAFTYWLPVEEAWGKQEDCLQSGEDSVIEHLKQQGWKNLEVFHSEFMSIEKDGEVFMGKTVVTGKSKGKKFAVGAYHYGKILYSGSSGFYCEAPSVVAVYGKSHIP